jgi:hypothetical protein
MLGVAGVPLGVVSSSRDMADRIVCENATATLFAATAWSRDGIIDAAVIGRAAASLLQDPGQWSEWATFISSAAKIPRYRSPAGGKI